MAITTPQGIDLQAPEALELKTVQANDDARYAISLVTRYEGLKVYVKNTGLNYQLKGGVTNSDWVQFGDPLDFDDFYTKVNMQTSGESQVHWDNLIAGTLPATWIPSAHTHVEADITDLQDYLLNITAQPIGDLSDVVITSPQNGQRLEYSGSNWINVTPGAAEIAWGDITSGLISDQNDLQGALNAKKFDFAENDAFNKSFGTAANTVAEGDHGHYFISVPESSAVATSIGLELNEVLYSDFIPQTSALSHKEGRLFYDKISNTLRMHNDIPDVSLDIGQELWGRVDNDNAYTLLNGKVGYVKGASVPAGNLLCGLADAADRPTAERVLGVFTNDIAPGGAGYITRYGIVRDIDTSLWAVGDLLYLDSHNPGEMTNERPIAPHYPVRVAIVMYSDALYGAIGVDTLAFTGSDTSVAADGFIDGVVTYKQKVVISVDTGIIYADVTRNDDPAHNLPFIIDGVRYSLNTTTNTGPGGAARIAIPPGLSATETQYSRLYIRLNAGVPELAITTSAPAEPYANLATFTVFDAARTLADGRPFMYRRSNNSASSEDIGIDGSFGLLTVAINAIRFKLGSNWLSGQDATPTVNDTTIRTTLSAGLGAQLHVSGTPLFDGLEYLIYNTTANLVTYEHSTNLTDIVANALGGTLLSNNTFYTIRLFYQLNSDGIGNNVIATRPTGSYTTSAEAIQDPSNYTVNLNDTSIEEVVYPIYDLVIGRTGPGGTTISLIQLTDLRTKLAGGVGGGGASGGGGTDDKVRVSAADTVNDYLFPKFVEGDNVKIEIVNPGVVEQIKISSGTTVGTGGDYATISAAITDGKYNLKLISDVTEVVSTVLSDNLEINLNTFKITFINNTITLVTYSFKISNGDIDWVGGTELFSNVTEYNLIFKNIVVTKTGTGGAYIADNGYFENVHFITSTGNYGSVRFFKGTITNCSVTGGGGAYAISCDNDCNINGLKLYGVQLAIVIQNTTNIIIDSAVTGRGTFVNSFNLISNALGFDVIRAIIKFGTIVDYTITTFGSNDQNLDSVTIQNATVTIDKDNCKYINCIFTGTIINSGDGNTFENCYLSAGTITIDATADKTVIIGCRTATSIVDNGTNTQLLANNLI